MEPLFSDASDPIPTISEDTDLDPMALKGGFKWIRIRWSRTAYLTSLGDRIRPVTTNI